MTTRKSAIKALLAGAILTLAASLPAVAAVDVSGYKFDDTAKVAGKDLKLNGAGMRTKFIVKVYAAGLYLPEKRNNTAEIRVPAWPMPTQKTKFVMYTAHMTGRV